MYLEIAAKSKFKSLSLVSNSFLLKKLKTRVPIAAFATEAQSEGRKTMARKATAKAPLQNHLKRWHTTKYNSAYADCKKEKDEKKEVSGSLTPMERKLKKRQSVKAKLHASSSVKKIWDINDQHSPAIYSKIIKRVCLITSLFQS